IVRELFCRLMKILAQGLRDDPGGTGRAAESQIDPAGEQPVERAELLGDDERVVVRQHDSARTDADGRRHVTDVRQHDGYGAARNSGRGMVFGHPDSLVPGPFGGGSELAGLGESFGYSASFADRDKIEDRQRDHSAVSSSEGSPSWAR